MLARVLEPEVMDTADEAADYDAMDHTAVNRVFASDFLAAWDGSNPILDVGTGTAQIPVELCRQSPTAKVVGIDLAAHMLRLGEANVHQAALSDRIRLQLVDAKGLPFSDGAFGAVMSNSIVHHIPDPKSVLAEVLRVVAPGGLVFVRDLLRPDDTATLGRIVATYAADANEHGREMFAASLHAALTLAEIRDLVSALGCDPFTVRQTTDRHWTWIKSN
jgi:ubiquinone/menaquinone biosynthesis C-methylase UbiE